MTKLPKLIEDLEALDAPQKNVMISYFVDPLNALKEDSLKFVEMIESTLDVNLADQGEFMIKPEFDENLQSMQLKQVKICQFAKLMNFCSSVEG